MRMVMTNKKTERAERLTFEFTVSSPSSDPSVSLNDAVVVNVALGAVVVLNTFTKNIKL
jgi:hypothetical protein